MTDGENRYVIGSDSINDPVLAVDHLAKVRPIELGDLPAAFRELGQAPDCGEQVLDSAGCRGGTLLGDPGRNVSHPLKREW